MLGRASALGLAFLAGRRLGPGPHRTPPRCGLAKSAFFLALRAGDALFGVGNKVSPAAFLRRGFPKVCPKTRLKFRHSVEWAD